MNRLRKSFNQLLDSDWLVRWSWWLATAFCLLFWLGAYAAFASPVPDHLGWVVQPTRCATVSRD